MTWDWGRGKCNLPGEKAAFRFMTIRVNTGPKCFSVAQASEDDLGACVAFTCWSDDVREGDERVKRLHKF